MKNIWGLYLKHYHLQENQSPTYFNLAFHLKKQNWSYTRLAKLAHFSQKHLEFDDKVTEDLEFKHQLHALAKQYCPHVMPETYFIHDGNWASILSAIAEKYYTRGYLITDQVEDIHWILKPSLLNNGQHIRIFQRLSDIESHFLSSNRVGGAHVLQRYIKPDLHQGKKYSIRLFVILTNYAGIHLYRDGYFNEAVLPYQFDDFSDLRSHLTNEHLQGEVPNVIQHPTQALALFPKIYPAIQDILTQVSHALLQKHTSSLNHQKQRRFAIFGFDLMVDETKHVWLLEANHGPCFPISREHPLQAVLYDHFWQAMIKSFVLPIASQTPIHAIEKKNFYCLSHP